jgi:hypothetical protein
MESSDVISENMFGEPTPMKLAILLGVPILFLLVLTALVGGVIYFVVRFAIGLAKRYQHRYSDSGDSD